VSYPWPVVPPRLAGRPGGDTTVADSLDTQGVPMVDERFQFGGTKPAKPTTPVSSNGN